MAFHESLLPVCGGVGPRVTWYVFPWHDGHEVADLAAEYYFSRGAVVKWRRRVPVREHGPLECRDVDVALRSGVLHYQALG